MTEARREGGEWTARLLLVSSAGALVELALVVPVFPAAASDARGLFALLVDCLSLYVVFGAPIALVAAFVSCRLRTMRLPSAPLLLACVVTAVLVATALSFLDRVAARHPAEFPDVIPALSFVARAAVVLVAAASLRWLASALERVLKSMPRLGEPRAVWAACSFVAAVAALAFAHVELAPVYLVDLAGVCGLVFLVLGLLAARLALRAPGTRIVRVAIVVCLLTVGSIPLRFDEHARFVLFGHVPVAGRFAMALRSAGDFDRDAAGARWLFGTDCAPFDPLRGPTLIEKPGDGVDQDCRGGDAQPRATTPSPGTPWAGCVPPERPTVLLVTIDAFRADRLSPDVTPFLAHLAGASTVYTRAYAPAGMTGASLASLFSGRSMTDLNTVNVLTDERITVGETFAARFAAAKYVTGGVTVYDAPGEVVASLEHFNRRPLDVSRDKVKSRLFAATLTDHTIDFLRRAGPAPALWWVHYPDAHAPYLLATDVDAAGLSPYEIGLAHVDQQLARVHEALMAMGKAASTIVVVTADHGEQLGERAREGHGAHLFEEGIRVPLLIHVPTCPGRVIEEPVSIQRLGATLVRLAGLPEKGPTLLPGSEPSDLPVVSEEAQGMDIGFKRAVIDGDFKLIVDVQNGGRMLFDLRADPRETQNIARRRPDVAARLDALYQRWLDATGDRR